MFLKHYNQATHKFSNVKETNHRSVYVKLNWMFKFEHLKEIIAVFMSNVISDHEMSFEIKRSIKHNFRLKLDKS